MRIENLVNYSHVDVLNDDETVRCQAEVRQVVRADRNLQFELTVTRMPLIGGVPAIQVPLTDGMIEQITENAGRLSVNHTTLNID